MKYDFVNQYAYFIEDIDDKFPDPLLDGLDVHMFLDFDHGHGNVTGRSTTSLFSVV